MPGAPAEIAGALDEERVERPERLQQLALVRGDLVGLGDVVGERPDVDARGTACTASSRIAARFSSGRSTVVRSSSCQYAIAPPSTGPPNVYSNPVAGTSGRSFS